MTRYLSVGLALLVLTAPCQAQTAKAADLATVSPGTDVGGRPRSDEKTGDIVSPVSSFSLQPRPFSTSGNISGSSRPWTRPPPLRIQLCPSPRRERSAASYAAG